MTSCIGFLISMFGTRMCRQTLLFIVIANCTIAIIVNVHMKWSLIISVSVMDMQPLDEKSGKSRTNTQIIFNI